MCKLTKWCVENPLSKREVCCWDVPNSSDTIQMLLLWKYETWSIELWGKGRFVLATLSDNSIFFQKLSNKSVNMSFWKRYCYLDFSFQRNVSIWHNKKNLVILQVVLHLIQNQQSLLLASILAYFCFATPDTINHKTTNVPAVTKDGNVISQHMLNLHGASIQTSDELFLIHKELVKKSRLLWEEFHIAFSCP